MTFLISVFHLKMLLGILVWYAMTALFPVWHQCILPVTYLAVINELSIANTFPVINRHYYHRLCKNGDTLANQAGVVQTVVGI
jgi:hypothetical protein